MKKKNQAQQVYYCPDCTHCAAKRQASITQWVREKIRPYNSRLQLGETGKGIGRGLSVKTLEKMWRMKAKKAQ